MWNSGQGCISISFVTRLFCLFFLLLYSLNVVLPSSLFVNRPLLLYKWSRNMNNTIKKLWRMHVSSSSPNASQSSIHSICILIILTWTITNSARDEKGSHCAFIIYVWPLIIEKWLLFKTTHTHSICSVMDCEWDEHFTLVQFPIAFIMHAQRYTCRQTIHTLKSRLFPSNASCKYSHRAREPIIINSTICMCISYSSIVSINRCLFEHRHVSNRKRIPQISDWFSCFFSASFCWRLFHQKMFSPGETQLEIWDKYWDIHIAYKQVEIIVFNDIAEGLALIRFHFLCVCFFIFQQNCH